MTKDTSRPAFPVERDTIAEQYGSPGLTKREYFAGLAMQGMLAGRKCELADVNLSDMTESATKIADALIAALEAKYE